ncbi:MAG: hypothetical protein JST17_11045 [Bacteroidetes bacterium]|nr:hypothetical protein [Bacteroidota bacterium]MBS1930074.1 hypothetical protein [Bacteroidota bacterium]
MPNVGCKLIMILTFKVDIPKHFNSNEKSSFLALLIEQGQVENPNLGKINSCSLLCIVQLDNNPVAIGAIKHVYKTPFTKAEVPELQNEYNDELGYIYVTHNKSLNVRGLGIATTICRLLLKKLDKTKVFATTEENEDNHMQRVLSKLSFKKVGITYQGNKTKKNISLFVKD